MPQRADLELNADAQRAEQAQGASQAARDSQAAHDSQDARDSQAAQAARDAQAGEPNVPASVDLTGQERMAWNVVVSWIGQFLFIVAGFFTPRLIDRRLGQETLGIWDFSWSMVSYFGLIQVGIGSSVGMYVARYRANRDMDRVSAVLSSTTFLLAGMAVGVLALTALIAWLLGPVWGVRLGEHTADAQVVLLALGASIAVQVGSGAFGGVITGCHRWDIHNYIKTGWHLATVAAMVVLLEVGLGIRSLAVASLAGIVLAEGTRVAVSFAICRGMRLGWGYVRWAMMRDAFGFGVKTLAPRVGDLLLNQTSSILIAAFLGPAALALYSRPKSLTYQVGMLVSKLALVLTPTASALHSTDRMGELRDLFVKATQSAACISFPLTLCLLVLGGPLLLVWMGPNYANGTLIALIAAGNLAMFTFMPAMSILAGLNVHGKPGMAHLTAAVCSVGLALVALGPLHMHLEGVALAVGIPLTLTYFLYVSRYTCDHLQLPWGTFMWKAFRLPGLCAIPFAAVLVTVMHVLADRPVLALLLGPGIGGLMLAGLYWRLVLSGAMRQRIRKAGRNLICRD